MYLRPIGGLCQEANELGVRAQTTAREVRMRARLGAERVAVMDHAGQHPACIIVRITDR